MGMHIQMIIAVLRLLKNERVKPIRNEEMAKYASEADRGILIAFPVGKSRGTRNMIKLAKQYGLEIEVVE